MKYRALLILLMLITFALSGCEGYEFDYTGLNRADEYETTVGPYAVGDLYNNNGNIGIVFEVDETGMHGKIVGLNQTEREWATEGNNNILVGASSTIDGELNMAAIKLIKDWRKKFPAFAWCADQGEGWYLPAIEELQTIFATSTFEVVNLSLFRIDAITLSSSSSYWSSTESDADEAYYLYPGNIDYYYERYKSYDAYSRAVYAF